MLSRSVAPFIFCYMAVVLSVTAAENVRLVSAGNDGKLVYAADEQGNRIPDFSRAGYMGGGVGLPVVPVRMTIEAAPGDGDDTARIQAELDKLSALAVDAKGFRGALMLKCGTYRIAGKLKIAASGVVLRGEGQKADGTILLATGKEQRTLISVGGKVRISEVKGSRHKVTDMYVPWGANSLPLDRVEGLKAGDCVIVYRPGTTNWIHDIGMDRIKEKPGNVQWTASGYSLGFERTVTGVSGKTINMDAPTMNALDEKYGGGFVYSYTQSGRIEHCGVECLRLVSEYEKGQEDKDEAHAWTGVSLGDSANCWVRNITTVHFSHAVATGGQTIFSTVQDCACLKPVSLITGGRRYPFSMNGQYGLVQRCYSKDARHAEATGAKTLGPNVFLDCLAEVTHADTGPHHRWAVGILWDNLKGGALDVQDRQNMGSGHGWAGAQQVFWNCEATSIVCQKPPTAQNYAIGCTGKKAPGSFPPRDEGHFESHGSHVEPRSLYLKQLEDRLGKSGVENITTEAQRKGVIYDLLRETLGV